MKFRDGGLFIVFGIVCIALTGHMLVRHLTRFHSLTPEKRARQFNLPNDHKMRKHYQEFPEKKLSP